MFQNDSSPRDLIPIFRDLVPTSETGRVVWLIERRHWKNVPNETKPEPGCQIWPMFWNVEEWRPAGRIRAATAAEALTDARSRLAGRPEDVRVSGISTLGIDDSEK